MQDHGVDRISLLQLEQELLHSLDGIVAAQVDHHLFDLETYTNAHSSVYFQFLSINRFLSFILLWM